MPVARHEMANSIFIPPMILNIMCFCGDVSTELQTEVSDYKVAADDKSDVYNQIGLSADK